MERSTTPRRIARLASPTTPCPAANRPNGGRYDARSTPTTETNTRWLDYELDVAKLLDFPVMTDMRDPITTRFHKAKLAADFHRPMRAEDLLDDRDAAKEYFDAVQNYVTAFNAAEAEAMRRRRSDFSREGQQRLARAQSLLRVAADSSATAQERSRAYDLACNELDGLMVLPGTTRASIERGIAGEIDG